MLSRATLSPFRLSTRVKVQIVPTCITRATFSTSHGFPTRQTTVTSTGALHRNVSTITAAQNGSTSSEKGKRAFPKRQDTTKRLQEKEYEEVAKDFDSFGEFVNYTVREGIKTDPKDRKQVRRKLP